MTKENILELISLIPIQKYFFYDSWNNYIATLDDYTIVVHQTKFQIVQLGELILTIPHDNTDLLCEIVSHKDLLKNLKKNIVKIAAE